MLATTPTSYEAPVHVASHVLPVSLAEAEALLEAGEWGVSEKVNGERCLVEMTAEGEMKAYNRKGQPVSTLPEGARVLAGINQPFLVDGERLPGGCYVVFDLMELNGGDVRTMPYEVRIGLLESRLQSQDILVGGGGGPVACVGDYRQHEGKLVLLAAQRHGKGDLVEQIRESGGEGLIFRRMSAPYKPGDTTDVLKFKYLTDIDCIVLGIKPGVATGSAILGLVRPSDGAIIEVGNVRGGLTDAHLATLGEMLARGERPVLKVEYLPIRTVGIRLVEPKTSLRQLRTDKLPEECTTDQFDQAKAALIAAAKPAKMAAK